MIRNPLKRFAESFEIVLTRRNACVILVLAFFGELAEWFKAPVLKTGVSERNRGFESHILRFGIFEDTQQHTDKCPIVQKTAVGASHHGEVPKRLKGHPWKGCRPLIAVRGFKSLLLRQRALQTQCSFLCIFRRAESAPIVSNARKMQKSLLSGTNSPKITTHFGEGRRSENGTVQEALFRILCNTENTDCRGRVM